MNDNIPDVKIEYMQDGIGDGLILLEQNIGCGEVGSVNIHPIHLRLMAEKMGLVETSGPQAHKTVATLKRRLLTLTDRINYLTNYLATYSDHKHADLSHELTYSTATSDIANEFCAEMGDAAPDSPNSGLPAANPIETQAEPNASPAPLFTGR